MNDIKINIVEFFKDTFLNVHIGIWLILQGKRTILCFLFVSGINLKKGFS